MRSRSRKNRPDPAAAPARRGAGGARTPGAAAAALLARRDYPRRELESRLREQGFEPADVTTLLDGLVAQSVVDDARYAERYMAYHAGRGHGPARIERELAALGLAAELIHAALDAGPDWRALARAQRARRFGAAAPSTWAEKARQARFLQYRGFSPDHIRSALGADDLD